MNALDLRNLLSALGLTQADLAQLVDVTPRAVGLWMAEQREIPGPVVAYLRLLTSLPMAHRAQELARLKESKPMADGLYRFDYVGRDGGGYGVLALTKGIVAGTDGQILYDGSYEPGFTQHMVDAHIQVSVPAGVSLVTGVPAQAMNYSFEVNVSFPTRGRHKTTIMTPVGEVGLVISHLRTLPN